MISVQRDDFDHCEQYQALKEEADGDGAVGAAPLGADHANTMLSVSIALNVIETAAPGAVN